MASIASGDTTTSQDEPKAPPGSHAHGADDEAASPDLPDDAIYNILTRLPPSSVTRFKVTCKSWLSLISHRSFKRRHRAAWARRQPATSVLLFDGSAGASRYPATVVGEAGGLARLALRRWRAEPRDGYAVQNCCGALACLRTGNGGAQILNPATGESLYLGGTRRGHRSTWTRAGHLPWYCLGRSPAGGGEYKVVRLDVRLPVSERPHLTCEVLTVGGDNWSSSRRSIVPQWKEVGLWDVNLCPADRGVHIAGVVYYLTWPAPGAGFVVRFDLDTQEHGLIELPGTEEGDDTTVSSLLELDGRLCVSLVPSRDEAAAAGIMRLYVLGNEAQGGGGNAWSQMYRFELAGAARRAPRPLLLRGRRMLVKRADGSLCYYDVGDSGGGGVATDEKVVFEHNGGRRRRQQQLSAATADVFVESLLPLRTILGAPSIKRIR